MQLGKSQPPLAEDDGELRIGLNYIFRGQCCANCVWFLAREPATAPFTSGHWRWWTASC